MAPPKLGDLIEMFRGPYQHWAVYVGDGFIVHLAPPSDVSGASANSLMSVTTKKAIVKKEKLRDVVGTNKWKISNSLDKMYKPRSVEVIVREALAKAQVGEAALVAGGAATGVVAFLGIVASAAVAVMRALNN